ncbi:MAG TPA: hypothetical protein VKR06_28340 [Ktedonosporobacter sp.]|nr:hypothetical protein [Ktedonosporobacter sp.]
MSKNRIIPSFLFVALLMVLSGLGLVACGPNQGQATGSISTPGATNQAANASTPAPTQPATNDTIATPTAAQSATNNTSATSAPSQAATNSAPTATPTLKSPDSVQNCGKITLSPLRRFEDAGVAQQAKACFWQAFQQCRAATLTFQPLAVDTVTNHTFLIGKTEGGCTITDTVSHAIVPHAPTITNYTCTGVVNMNTALRFTSCGAEGDVIVPLVQ